MIRFLLLSLMLSLFACKKKVETIKPTVESVSESIYASGIIKSKNQYQAFATVNGIIEKVFVTEGDTVKKGTPILSVSNQAQKLGKENAELAASFFDIKRNQEKLKEAELSVEFARNKLRNDSLLFFRQKNLWEQQIGSKIELEQRELTYQNSKNTYATSILKYKDLKRQLDFTSAQAKKNLLISSELEDNYTLRSEINGIVYQLMKSKGEIVTAQTPLATIGDAQNFTLEMQVDEYDILKIKMGLPVLITLDSYKEKVFEARITRINPLMNERSKTFLVEAEFTNQPPVLYPNISFEASIVLQSKSRALLIPRNYLLNDSIVVKSNGKQVTVKTGLKDYRKVEIISGITENDELINPAK